jgi:hypothetical protein
VARDHRRDHVPSIARTPHKSRGFSGGGGGNRTVVEAPRFARFNRNYADSRWCGHPAKTQRIRVARSTRDTCPETLGDAPCGLRTGLVFRPGGDSSSKRPTTLMPSRGGHISPRSPMGDRKAGARCNATIGYLGRGSRLLLRRTMCPSVSPWGRSQLEFCMHICCSQCLLASPEDTRGAI